MFNTNDVSNYMIHAVSQNDLDRSFSVPNSHIELVDPSNSFEIVMDEPDLWLPQSLLYINNEIKVHIIFERYDITDSELDEIKSKYESSNDIKLGVYRIIGEGIDKFYRSSYSLISMDTSVFRSISLNNIPDKFAYIPIGSYLLIGIESIKKS